MKSLIPEGPPERLSSLPAGEAGRAGNWWDIPHVGREVYYIAVLIDILTLCASAQSAGHVLYRPAWSFLPLLPQG